MTWPALRAWISQEWTLLREQVAALLPHDALEGWNSFQYNGNPGRRKEISSLANGLTPENLETVIRVAREEFNADLGALQDSNALLEPLEESLQTIRVMNYIRERLEGVISEDQNFWLENYLTANERAANAALESERAQ